MSGHSHWATIRRKKGAADAKKGAIFTRLAREIVMAARDGGGDLSSNVRLALAVEKARAQNMPKDNIERAIKRGSGEDKSAAAMEEVTYEGIAPHGISLMIECVTDNRNRAVAEIRHTVTRLGGTLGQVGSVGWKFSRAAYFAVLSEALPFDKAFELGVEAGADDVAEDGDLIEIIGPVESFKAIGDKLQAANVQPEEAGLRMIAKQEMELDPEKTIAVMKVIEALEELDDVQNVFSDLRISEEALAAVEAEG